MLHEIIPTTITAFCLIVLAIGCLTVVLVLLEMLGLWSDRRDRDA